MNRLSNSNMKQFLFSILFLLPITILAQDQQQRVWLLLNKNQVESNGKSGKVSVDEGVLKIMQETHIDSAYRVFPYSKNDTLQRLFEIRATINQLNLISSSPEIETIFFPSDGEETALYQPSDYMWYCNYPDSTNWLWHLKKIMADNAWDITKGDTSIRIAILDTWFDINHPDLQNKMFCTYDPYDGQPFYSNGTYVNHGTTVASFAAAETDGGGQLASVGFNCKIIPYNAWSGHYLERAHHASLFMNADILTSSAGGWICDRNFNDIERIAVREILDNGTVIVMPAGNGEYGARCYNSESGMDQPWRPLHPYYDDRIIIVSGTNKNDFHQNALDSSLSHFPEVDICAPGYNVMGASSTLDKNGNAVTWPYYGSYIGTSFSTPVVAGVCALVKSVNRCLTPEDVQDIIKQTADSIQDEYLYPGMLGAGRVNAYKAVTLAQTYHSQNDTIISNDTWSTNSFRGGTVVIDSLATLTITGTLHCAPSARLIVRPGGKLVVDGGTLTNSCTGEMWQGIDVVGDRTQHQVSSKQGSVVLKNGAVVENARCGIRTHLGEDTLGFTTTGGIITAENTTFRNCAKAVAYLAYFDTLANGYVNDNQGSFTNCTFTVDDNNLFAANNTAFSDHISLWAVKGVKFHGCTFNNLTSNQSDRRHAINAHSAGFVADVYCNGYEPSPSDCGCPAGLSDSCIFVGFSTAIEANTDGSPLAVTVNRAQFANNGTAVRINANNFATVTECDFNLQSVPAGWLENTGLYLDNCTGYLVEGNSFLKTTYSQPINLSSTGIYVKNSGTAKNTLHRNGFTNLNYGVYVKNNNGNSQSGLQLSCNDFYGNNYDIYLPYKSTLKASQGNLFKGADNTFSGTRTSSIYNYGTQQLTYYYSRGSSHAPYNVSSTTVTLNSGATANDCASTLCGGLIYQPLTGLSAFTSLMFSYTPAIPSPMATDSQTSTDGIAAAGSPTTDDASTIYNTAVRALMADTLLDLAALEQWHAAAQPIADPYSLTETRFALGYDEVFSPAASTIPSPQATEPQASTDGSATAEPPTNTDEFSDYVRFHNLKRELRDADENAINWYALTSAQIAQLQDLAENGTGRSSVMARGVLCFFYGICYDDEDFSPTGDIRRLASSGEAGNPSHNSDVSMKLYPNPAGNTLHVEFEGTDDPQGTLTVTDITGVAVLIRECHDPVTQLDVSHLTPGLYVVSFRNEKGVVVRKFVKM